MNCTISIQGNYARVSSDVREGGLSLDFSQEYCRLFETTKSQGRDYMNTIYEWCGDRPENTEAIIRSLLMYLAPLRQNLGLAR